MSKRIDIWGTIRNVISTLAGVLGYFLAFFRLMLKSKAALAAEVLALRAQLVACADAIDRKKAPKPRFTLSFRLLWFVLARFFPDWRKYAHVMQPATVVVWHRRIARFIWHWKSRPGHELLEVPSELGAMVGRDEAGHLTNCPRRVPLPARPCGPLRFPLAEESLHARPAHLYPDAADLDGLPTARLRAIIYASVITVTMASSASRSLRGQVSGRFRLTMSESGMLRLPP